MNGEPREQDAGALDGPSEARRRASAVHDADQPLPAAINPDGVVKTVVKEDSQLAALFTQEAASEFRSQWDLVQRSFVDDPRAAVHAADELVAQVTQSLAETFASQRSELEKGLDQAGARTTENLRIALRQYRSFFERLLSI